MKYDEMKTRWEGLHSHVITQTAQAFVNTILMRCVRAHTGRSSNDLCPCLTCHASCQGKHLKKRLLLGSYPVHFRVMQF
jgi:hypothetical protein